MAAPVDLNISPPGMASITQPIMNRESPVQTLTHKQTPSSGKEAQDLVPKGDRVVLSNEAIDMSKELQQKHDILTARKDENKWKEEQQKVQHVAASVSSIKHFPPFMGNTESLNQLKQSSPALYKEILKMMVPPPLSISYMDAQTLQGTDRSYKDKIIV